MAYRIEGLDPALFAESCGASDDTLARHGAVRVVADKALGYPCRITLEDAEPGETLLLLPPRLERPGSPFGFTYAIFVQQDVPRAAQYLDAVPPIFAPRVPSLRGFDEDGVVRAAALAQPGEADAAIERVLDDPAVVYIDVHNAVAGCFAARVERA